MRENQTQATMRGDFGNPATMRGDVGNPASMCGNPACNSGNEYQMSRKDLYEWIMMLFFCAYDMLLYLDTHPDDSNALDYFNQCNELYNSAKRAYEQRYGRLDAFGDGKVSCWDWNTAPMPWEGGF